jgi:hypothetical protein
MRLRIGLVLCLFSIFVAVGCREPLTPNVDRNQPPETWISAAPFDTITLDKDGFPPRPGTIPVRFHVYWAGSDPDGAVAGFYYAVTETLPLPPPNAITVPPVPGPKPRDYRFTTRTDSTFIFNVAETVPDRQHAFFIYAVDNQGKPDPTPARFVFAANDKFPPKPIFLPEGTKGVGKVYYFDRVTGELRDSIMTKLIQDSDVEDARFRAPRDTVPSCATLYFRWSAQLGVAGNDVTGFKYKLDEPDFVAVDRSVNTVTYTSNVGADTQCVASGTKIFVLRAIDRAGGSNDSTRRFQLNFSPDSWWSGPDLDNVQYSVKPSGEKYVALTPGDRLPFPIDRSLFSRDSVYLLPALRPERRTFFELYNDTLYARAEFDTVHLNSIVVLHSGGFDRDSRYLARTSDLARMDTSATNRFPCPPLEDCPVLDPAPANGSPIGFRTWMTEALSPTNGLSLSAQTGVYPLFDPNDVFNDPQIGGYHAMIQSGKVYALTRAVDGDGDADRRISAPWTIGENIAECSQSPGATTEQKLRCKVLVFYVNKAPFLRTQDPAFFPPVDSVITYTSPEWDMFLPAFDEDPFEPPSPQGVPSGSPRLRHRITIYGTQINTQTGLPVPLVYTDRIEHENEPAFRFTAPPELEPGPVTVEVELCDCHRCELFPGTGRCIKRRIQVMYQPSAPRTVGALRR